MYSKKTHIHFVGIGGIGMSSIAKILVDRGYHVSGCDAHCNQKTITDLKAAGCTIQEGNNGPACHDTTIGLFVFSSDVHTDHPEFIRAQQQRTRCITRGELLAELTRTKYTVAIAGSHGKTTTTALTAHIFITANLDPTVLVGGHVQSLGSNVREGAGQFLVTETDESDRSLLHLFPTIAILTNIDREHLNNYQNLHDIAETFRKFLQKIPFYGSAIVCVDDPVIASLLPLSSVATITYGSNPAQADWSYADLLLEPDYSSYQAVYKGKPLGNVTVALPGKHNVLNSLAALAAALQAGIDFETAAGALATFSGVDRRFTFKGTFQGADIFDDYGHHPTEIACTLSVAKKRAQKKVILVFQPHRYSRMSTLWHEFTQFLAHNSADHSVITDIYASSESPLPNITGALLAEEAQRLNPQALITYIPFESNFKSLKESLSSLAEPGDLILLQGAGSITKLADTLLDKNL